MVRITAIIIIIKIIIMIIVFLGEAFRLAFKYERLNSTDLLHLSNPSKRTVVD